MSGPPEGGECVHFAKSVISHLAQPWARAWVKRALANSLQKLAWVWAIAEGLTCGQVVCTLSWVCKTGYYTCAVVIETKQILNLIASQDYNLNLFSLIGKILPQGNTFVIVDRQRFIKQDAQGFVQSFHVTHFPFLYPHILKVEMSLLEPARFVCVFVWWGGVEGQKKSNQQITVSFNSITQRLTTDSYVSLIIFWCIYGFIKK